MLNFWGGPVPPIHPLDLRLMWYGSELSSDVGHNFLKGKFHTLTMRHKRVYFESLTQAITREWKYCFRPNLSTSLVFKWKKAKIINKNAMILQGIIYTWNNLTIEVLWILCQNVKNVCFLCPIFNFMIFMIICQLWTMFVSAKHFNSQRINIRNRTVLF